ncbi:MAG TPA: Trk family potassium uptake protein [Firmicutes bacterium]|nr:Trk family potassium uptake protein [Bacillota bacterium]
MAVFQNTKAWTTPTRVLVFSFLSFILVGTILLMLPWSTLSHGSPGFIDSLFTATSAVCVTGLVVVNTASYWSMWGKVVILILIQAGGLGLMTFATAHALVTGRRVTLTERLIIQEQTGYWSLSGLVRLMKRVILATLVFEFLGALVLGVVLGKSMGLELPGAMFHGLFHSVSAFCNAGFDILGSSLVPYAGDPLVIMTVSLLIIIGGLGFYVITDVYENRGKWRDLSLHSRIAIKMTGALLVIGTVLVLVLEGKNPGTIGNMSLRIRLLSSWFQSVTARTAGFDSIFTENLRIPTSFIMIALMFVGASPGGTGGGIKTTTFYSSVRFVAALVQGKEDVNVSRRRLPEGLVLKALSIILISLGLISVSTLLLTITEEASFFDILFEVVSAFGTVGLSRGITPSLSIPGKLIIIVTMFAGRVGPLSLAVAISKQANQAGIRYPEEKVLVG